MSNHKHPFLKHPFETHAAQKEEDKIVFNEEGFFTPDIYFTNGPRGLWLANNLRGYIIRRGYQAEIAIDPVNVKALGVKCLHLKVGTIPEIFLGDIKDYMSIEEIRLKRSNYCVHMDDNGKPKPNAETAMMLAFEALRTRNQPKSRPS